MAAKISRRALIAGGVAVAGAAVTAGPALAQFGAVTGSMQELAANEQLVGAFVRDVTESFLWLATDDGKLLAMSSSLARRDGDFMARGSRVWLARERGFVENGGAHYHVRARILRWVPAESAEASHARAVNRLWARRNSEWIMAEVMQPAHQFRKRLWLTSYKPNGELDHSLHDVRAVGVLKAAQHNDIVKIRLGRSWEGLQVFDARMAPPGWKWPHTI